MNPFSLVVWRDSVCLADDYDAPHEMKMEVSLDTPLDFWLAQLVSRSYLASIAGNKATWILEGRSAVAVVAQQWSAPRFLVWPQEPLAHLLDANAKPHFEFRYWSQADPDLVFQCLQRGEPLPDR